MLAVKVQLREAEKVRKLLLNERVMDFDYLVESDRGFVYFPVKKECVPSSFPKTLVLMNKRFRMNPKKRELKDVLSAELAKKEITLLNRSYDVVGSIAILDIPEELKGKEKIIAQVLMSLNKNIKTVLNKSGIHEGEFRTQKLRYISGIKTKETLHKENDVLVKLDVERVYFSPRLSTERKRIAGLVKPGERVLVMFSGCGPYPLVISRNAKARKIIGIEKNRLAHEYALKSLALNKIKNVRFILGDVRKAIPRLRIKFDRIVMPLPKNADSFLDTALRVAKKNTVVHIYLFLEKEGLEESKRRLRKICSKEGVRIKLLGLTKCGQYSPTTFRTCLDFQIV